MVAGLPSVNRDAMPPDGVERLRQATLGHRAAHALRAAIELGLFTELARGPRTLRQLRRTLGLTPARAERATPDLLDALVAMGLLEREGDDADAVYVNSRDAGRYLDRRGATYVGDDLVAEAARDEARWHGLAAALRRDAPAAPPPPPAASTQFAQGVEALLQRVDFAPWRTLGIADGGSDRIAHALRALQPRLRCVPLALDAPWPTQDAIVLVGTLGSAPQATKQALLQRAHAALPARGGTLIAIDMLIDDARRGALHALLASLDTALEAEAGGGYTAAEFDRWCRAAGFAATERVPLTAHCSAVVARR